MKFRKSIFLQANRAVVILEYNYFQCKFVKKKKSIFSLRIVRYAMINLDMDISNGWVLSSFVRLFWSQGS